MTKHYPERKPPEAELSCVPYDLRIQDVLSGCVSAIDQDSRLLRQCHEICCLELGRFLPCCHRLFARPSKDIAVRDLINSMWSGSMQCLIREACHATIPVPGRPIDVVV
jgi:hypothetical protein